MLRSDVRRRHFLSVPPVAILFASFVLVFPALLHAGPQGHLLTGVVVDQAGSPLVGARLTLRAPSGRVVDEDTTNDAGAFSLGPVPPGSYVLLVERAPLAPLARDVTVGDTDGTPRLRLTLSSPGYAETVVVTARRAEAPVGETAQKTEVVDTTDVERSVAADLTDLLKKNAGVDVVQYSGALSGVGLRGFRPQFSGINKRSLLLVDGRPSGITNLATLLLDGVRRVEVLKGAASALYGSSAMGGVVNVVTRRSSGPLGGEVRLGGGSFGSTEAAGRAGGSLGSILDFDVNAGAFVQRDDYRMGGGGVRPATSYRTWDGAVRLGIKASAKWRIDGRLDAYRGRDIMTPGDVASGVGAQGRKDLERSSVEARVTGSLSSHALTFVTYRTSEDGHISNVTTGDPLDRPYLPYLSYESALTWVGAQARDAWKISSAHSVLFGTDVESVTSTSRSYGRTGDRTAPFSADSDKRSIGVYAEQTTRLHSGWTVIAFGGRLDHVTTRTLDTPLKTNFTPSRAAFSVFNPSIGLTQRLTPGTRVHATLGRAFIPAEASMLTGSSVAVVKGRTQLLQGNSDLKPERSTSVDAGLAWEGRTTRLDVTAFRTFVRDRFISNVVISNPPPPAPIVLSVANGLDAHLSGLELEIEQRVGGHVGVWMNVTHYFQRKERLLDGAEQDILNVGRDTVRAAVDIDVRRLSARLSARYVHGRKDNDFYAPGFPVVECDDVGVVDLSAAYRLTRRHAVLLAVNNLFDAYYYEKIGFPLQGASFRVSYRLGF